ncbi:MAG: hypothetical protein ACM34I_12835 [bacterium]
MNLIRAIGLSALFTLLSVVPAFSFEGYQKPYGEFCPVCSSYGVCTEYLSESQSREAISMYYEKKGVSVGQMNFRGRFVEVEIIRDGQMLDKVLFDRKTGRIRSIY